MVTIGDLQIINIVKSFVTGKHTDEYIIGIKHSHQTNRVVN